MSTIQSPPAPVTLPVLAIRFVASLAALCVSAPLLAAPEYHRADQPIIDAQGRTRIIIDFVDDAHQAFPRGLLAQFDPTKDKHQPQVLALVEQYERLVGFKRLLMTSWVGSSATAFLDTAQIERLKRDPMVKLLTEDAYMQYSSPLWYPAWNGDAWGELNDWGRVAVSGKDASSLLYGAPTVYIIDSGVAYHDDLGSVTRRVNVACSTPTYAYDCADQTDAYGSPGPYSRVGCYSHATHVAGIVGATSNNGKN